MRKGSLGFTLIEVMLAVAIFAFAVVGFAVALNDVLGVNSEILRTAQRRQAVESVAAQILARSNNFAETGWVEVPGWGSAKTWTVTQRIQPVLVNVPGPNNAVMTLGGWWRVEIRALDEKEQPLDRIAFLLWGQR